MDIARTTVPGVGVLHHCSTRAGQRFGVMVDETDRRSLLIYESSDDPDVPRQTIVLDHDEADQVADLLRDRSVSDRLAVLERRLAELSGKAS
ncbi:hypothetical protein IMZ11_30760 [Microtetraspora sp. AC03309]|uniref:hypothetical protein n=1 Tax=Microtetraspora sp. AC03309 TaxID=2779376 RepID=UPI000774C557|nr:hypothetical protein [Microtetraspora sp. AC03309]MCC5580014.1 hypothetical protein [Microtetraspora sp. AC03309]